MLFNDIKTEHDVERLKKRIVKDDALFLRIENIRKKMRESASVTEGLANPILVEKSKAHKMPTNAETMALYKEMVLSGEQNENTQTENILRKIKTRSNSGVAVVSLLTKPYPCPGRCTYCPDADNMPKSYLEKEPAAARALAVDFDPYKQVQSRLRALQANGHPTDKIEMIVIGGTWSFYHPVYQEEFITECFRACNNFNTEKVIQKGEMTLKELQEINEKAGSRMIGLSIETRPDYITSHELERLRMLGVTKVEIGVQHLDNDILRLVQRDMTYEGVAEATEKLRNAGFKVVYHMMPNLPGSNIKKDIEMFKELFAGEQFQPDMLKIYPCMVLDNTELYETWKKGLPSPKQGVFYVYVTLCNDSSFYIGITDNLRKRYGEHQNGVGSEHTKKHPPVWMVHYEEYSTREEAVKREKELKTEFGRKWLKREWNAGKLRQAGDFKVYTNEELMEVLTSVKKDIPPYVRLIRVIRDIPAEYIKAGSIVSNMRQWLEEDMKKNNWKCRCVRCREVRNESVHLKDFKLVKREYKTETGKEIFLSYEHKDTEKLAAFLRLRLPMQIGEESDRVNKTQSGNLSVLRGAALVRELHTYGQLIPVSEEGVQSQHVGLGKRLMQEAELIAREGDYKKIAVISGVGVRDYYRKKLGYEMEDTYMVKYL